MPSVTVIIPTIGAPTLHQAISSVLNQVDSDVRCWVVIDGPQFADRTRAITDRHSRLGVIQLPENTGGDGFYGHRIYAACGFLINTDYVLYLDQDNWIDSDHVATAVNTIEAGRLDWCYSLRKIHDPSGTYLLDDDCESLGRWPTWVDPRSFLVDTSCYCIKREVIARMSGVWYGKWGTDRIFLATLAKNFPQWGCTGRPTLNYRLGGNPGSVTKDFFVQGNAVMRARYPGGFPWRSPSGASRSSHGAKAAEFIPLRSHDDHL